MRGAVEHIHLASARAGPVEPVDQVLAEPGRGLRGDRHHGRPGANDLTLIEAEALERMADEHGVALDPGESRRNVTTRGVDLGTLIGRLAYWSLVLSLWAFIGALGVSVDVTDGISEPVLRGRAV